MKQRLDAMIQAANAVRPALEDFYAALISGKLAHYDVYDESRADFSRWKGIYKTLCRRKESYRKLLEGRDLAEVLRVQPAY